MKRSANKYSVLKTVTEQEVQELNMMKEREEVDQYIRMREQPPLSVTSKWSHDMVNYFKDNWKQNFMDKNEEKRNGNMEKENVHGKSNGIAKSLDSVNIDEENDEDMVENGHEYECSVIRNEVEGIEGNILV